MKKIIKTFFFFLCLSFLGGCSDLPASKKPSVVVTLSPYHYFVKEIAGDTLEVSCLIAKGKNPHTFDPTFKDTQKILNSSIWFYLNEPFEGKILPTIGSSLVTIDLCKSIPLLSSSCVSHCHEKQMDRHLWLSPRSLHIQCQTIADALIEMFPQYADLYKKNLESLQKRLFLLDQEISKLFSFPNEKALFVTHPAFTYFCRDYKIEQIFLLQEGKELNWHDQERIFSQVKAKKITALFHQKQYNYQVAKEVAAQLHLSLIVIDPFAENYFENMLKMATLFATSMNKHDISNSD